MKSYRLFFAAAILATVSVSAAQAQTKPAPTQTAPSTAAALPNAKVALIYSEAFQDPKAGIIRFGVLLTNLNREFEKVQKDLNDTALRIQQLQDEVTKAQAAAAVVDPKSIQAKIDQAEQLQKDYKRKGEDAQTNYSKRRAEVFQPLQEDISKALDAFAKANGITIIIDASQVPVVYVADSVDVTKAFIAAFNAKNPATAVVTTPK
jgi:outer membrane protein